MNNYTYNNDNSNNNNDNNIIKISELTFLNGLYIVGITILSVIFLIGLIKWSSLHYNKIITNNNNLNNSNNNFNNNNNEGEEKYNLNIDDDEDESDNERHGNLHLSNDTSNIVKSHLMNLQGKKKSHDGVEFIKLNHYDNHNIHSINHLRGSSV